MEENINSVNNGGNNTKQKQLQVIVLLLIGFIIGFAAHAFVVSREDAPVEPEDNQASTFNVVSDLQDIDNTQDGNGEDEGVMVMPVNSTTLNNMPESGYTVSVADQKAGGIVYASQLVFEKESWLAIREQVDGQIGNILGAQRYPAGTHTGVVKLLRDTNPGRTYYAVIFIDDGDGKFDFKKDAKLTDTQGSVVTTIFKIY